MLEDESREQIANELRITINTLRTHAKVLFDKTGISSRGALVRLLMSVARKMD